MTDGSDDGDDRSDGQGNDRDDVPAPADAVESEDDEDRRTDSGSGRGDESLEDDAEPDEQSGTEDVDVEPDEQSGTENDGRTAETDGEPAGGDESESEPSGEEPGADARAGADEASDPDEAAERLSETVEWDRDDPLLDVEPIEWAEEWDYGPDGFVSSQDLAAHQDGRSDASETDEESTSASPRGRSGSGATDRNRRTPQGDRNQDEDGGGDSTDGSGDDKDYRGAPYLEDDDENKAPDDEEMPLADHIEEMIQRLGVVLVLMAGVSAIVFPFGEQIINQIWYSFLPGTFEQCPTTGIVPEEPSPVIAAVLTDIGAGPGVTMAESASVKPACPRVYHPLATLLARFKISTLAGFVIALPAFVYETYLFMRPGLFPRERRYYLAAVPTSLVLAAVGVAFAYLLVLPAIFTYFLYYSEGAAAIAFGLTETFDLMVLMLGFFAAIFQIPLFIMLAIMMGVTSRQWLADRRLLFWAAFAGIAFIFNPDPTGMAPFIVAATMIALFEGTLLLLSWTGSEGLLPAPDAVAARRPYIWLLAVATGYLVSDSPVPAGYYDQLPGLLRAFIEANDLLGMTPIVVGGLFIAVYELLVYVLLRYLPVGSWRRRLFTGRVSLFRLRRLVWILSLLVGYFASPNPFLLDRAAILELPPTQAAALVVGLIVAFEVLLALWRYVRPDEAERLPLER